MTSDGQLSEVLSDFARTMVTDFSIQAILDELVGRIVEMLPVTAAGVTLISPGVEPRYVAASDGSALRFEQLQTDLGEGPCLAACQSNETISVPDLHAEGRFPTFTARALEAGLVAVFALPLRHRKHQLGALDLYRDSAGELNAEAMIAAQTLADVTTAYLVNAEARADLEESSRRYRHISLHDPLTGLPNRVLLMERLEQAILRSRRSALSAAVLFIDLDQFKGVNDRYGHGVGDDVLVEVARRLSDVLRPGDTLARVSGDEFVAVCEEVTTVAQAEGVVARLDAALARPLVLPGSVELSISASVGVAFTGQDVVAEDVVDASDKAMYRAKQAGGARHEFLNARDRGIATYEAGLQRDLHGLLGRDELHLAYQPIVETADGHLTGVEALLRWRHPSRGLVMPSVLVPLAERAGEIPAIGKWVLEGASAEQDHWQHAYPVSDVTISVNVSAQQLMSDGFVATVAAIVRARCSPPERLVLEMTESVSVQDGQRALALLNDLKELGVKLALDDFGTGYSSLSYLRQFPFDIVKIDQTFIAGLARDQASQIIVASTIQLAHELGLTVTAEGVETIEQHHELIRLGCDSCQGFYFARPMASAGIDTLIDPLGNGNHLPARTLAQIKR